VQDDGAQPHDLAPSSVRVVRDAPDGTGDNAGLLVFVVRRLLLAAAALLVVAVIDYAMFDLPRGLERAFLHLDFGRACSHYGCPAVKEIWSEYWRADIYLLFGSLALGVVAGFSGAVFCSSRPRSLATRAVETLGLLFYSMPAYLFGLGVLLLFEPSFGAFPLPFFFHPLDYQEPFEDPWMFVQAMIVPWIVLAAPFAAVVMRLAQANMLDELGADYVRTAEAKGLHRRRVVRRHAGRPAFVSVAALVGVWVPSFITNMVLVEYVFFVPGFFGQTKRALGQVPELPPGVDVPMVQALGLWAAVLVVVVSALADVVLVMLDPRVRATVKPVG
jgi:peptide/nickel transport system permease protein